MLFNSEVFIIFCAVFFPIYFLLRSSDSQNAFTFAASLVFYGWWNWKFLFLIGGSIVVNYLLGWAIDATNKSRLRKCILLLALMANLSLLATFKYATFLLDSIAALLAELGLALPEVEVNILLPVGISFFTFQAMSYIIDIYKGTILFERGLIRFGAYISLFPQLVAGPIVRASFLLPQLDRIRRFSWVNFWLGLEMFVVGAVLKILVANRLSPIVDQVYAQYQQQDPLSLLLATTFFAFQIYGDFAGYSLMAIGIGRVMGLRFPPNFRRPYMSTGFSDFWRRWHISLSSWLRDYLYIPLGGSWHGKWKRNRNLMVTMLLGGLWHGASWAFVFWGFLHGSYQVVQAVVGRKPGQVMTRLGYPGLLLTRLFVFTLVCVAWVYFRVTDFGVATEILITMLDFGAYSIMAVGNKVDVALGLAIIVVLVIIELLCEDTRWTKFYRRSRLVRVIWCLILIQLLILFGSFSGNAFIYFQF